MSQPSPIDRIELVVATGARPLVMNASNRGHHMARHTTMEAWRTATAEALMLARVNAHLTRVGLCFYPVYPNRVQPDTDGIYPTCKAILDGLVAAGIVPDDNGPHVEFFSMEAPVYDPDVVHPFVRVHVFPRPPVSGHGVGECGCEETRLRRARGRRVA